MDHDPSTRDDDRLADAGESRRRVRRGSVPARRRRAGSTTATGRATSSRGRYRHGDGTPRAITGAASAADPTGFGWVDPPRGLAWLLGLARSGDPSRALTASGLLWLFVYAGWRAGVLDAAATLWLSASVVAVNHVLRAAERPRGRQAGRGPGV